MSNSNIDGEDKLSKMYCSNETNNEIVYKYLFECSDKELVRKTISKIVDSYRFSDEEKNKFKSLREKL